MKKSSITLIILAMTLLGVVFGLISYILCMNAQQYLVLFCILSGAVYGLLSAFIMVYAIKRYSVVLSKNNKLMDEIRTDKLTGLNSRFAYGNDMKSLACNMDYSLIYLDVDDFSNFNNTYGHHAGDIVLKRCADIIRHSIRTSDMAYRYGGEELVVVLGGCKKDAAIRIAQNIVDNIRNIENTPYPRITISAGVATLPDDAPSFDQLINASDLAMLVAKRNGKDRVVAQPI